MPLTNHHWRITGFIFSFTIFFTINHLVWSQTKSFQDDIANYYPKKFINHIDVQFGPSIVYMSGDQVSNEIRRSKFGLSTGVGLNHAISDRFDLVFNFLFEKKGYKSSVTYSNTDFNPPATEVAELNYTFNYYTLVVLPVYNVKNKNISFGIGPYFSYLSNIKRQSEIYQNGKLVASSSIRTDVGLNSKYDVGIALKTGYNFSIHKTMNFIELRYSLGLLDFQKNSTFQSFYNGSITFYYGFVLFNR